MTYYLVISFLLQVETVGDKYMAVSGLPEPCTTHAKNIANLALDMMDLGKTVLLDGKPVVIIDLLRFHVFQIHFNYKTN